MITEKDRKFLNQAILEARKSVMLGGFPVGVVIVKNNKIIARGVSNGKKLNDPTSHAETEAIRKACGKIKSRNLKDTVLYSSSEPCMMCFHACHWAFIPKIVYGLSKNKHPKIFFEGKSKIQNINKNLYKPINIQHIKDAEKAVLDIINLWKKKI